MTSTLETEQLKLRLLLLIGEVEKLPSNAGKLDGLTKLAKLDFLCRNVDLAERIASELPEHHGFGGDTDSFVDGGPWDDRYYEVLGSLVGRGLVRYARGRQGSIGFATTPRGRELSEQAASLPVWSPVRRECMRVAERFGEYSGEALQTAIFRSGSTDAELAP